LTFSRIELSSVCITNRMIVRREVPLIFIARTAPAGLRRTAAMKCNHLVPRVPASTIIVNSVDCESPPEPYVTTSMWVFLSM